MKRNALGFASFWLTLLSLCLSVHAVSPIAISPLSGPASTVVTIEGHDFDSDSSYTVNLGEIEIDATYIGPTSLEFTIPQAAPSGFVVLKDGAQSSTSDHAFLVTRPITVSFDPLLGLDTTGYDIGTIYSSATAAGSNYTLDVDTAGPSLVITGADSPTTIPVYGIATTDSDHLVLGAASTVEAFAFISSFFYTADETELAKRLDHLRGQTTYATAVSTLQSQFSSGTDFIESDELSAQIEAMLLDYTESYADFAPPLTNEPSTSSAAKAFSTDYTTGFENLAPGFPRELKKPGYERLDRIIAKPNVKVPGRNGVPILRMKMDAAPVSDSGNDDGIDNILKQLTANPLDWSANLYELDINDHRIDSPDEVEALTEASWTAYYNRVNIHSLDTLIVPAKPITRYVDLVGLLKDEVKKRSLALFTESVLPNPDAIALKSTLTVPSERPGIYMIRSYSGAIFPEQDALIASLPYGKQEDFRMMALNIILLFNDSYAFIVGQSNTISSNEWAKFLFGLEKSITASFSQKAAQGTLSSEALLAIYWESSKAVTSWVIDQGEAAAKDILGELTKGRFGRLKAFVGKALNVSNKVASVAKVVERLAALTNAPRLLTNNARMALALEDTLLVVGDPWAPLITSFSPTSGYRGTQVTIFGEGFSTEASENTVTFGYNSTSTEAPPQAAQAKVNYADYRGYSLTVEVPEEASTGVITVDVPDAGRSSTASNDVPYHQFTVLPDPKITSISPAQPTFGEPIIITGTGFRPNSGIKLTLTGTSVEVIPQYLSPTQLFAQPPAVYGPQTLSLVANGRETSSHPIEMIPSETPPSGLTITVTTTADNNVRDDQISLREAIMLANGTLSKTALTSPPDPRPSKTKYETDYVTGDQLGTASKNSISSNFYDETFTLTSPLPQLESYDSYWGITIDATNISGTPLVLDGVEGVELANIVVLNAQEDALLITGGSHNNTIHIDVQNAARHGIYLKDSAHSNTINGSVENVGQYGVYLSGDDVRGNQIQNSPITGPGLWGAVIDNGAKFNHISGHPGAPVSGFTSGGIWISGDTSRGNFIGSPTDYYTTGGSFFPIFDNGGPGIRAEAPETRIELVNPYGNDSHGIIIGGANASDSTISVSRIGYIAADGTANPNQGSGIYVQPDSKNILIGARSYIFNHHINSIAGNNQHGILIEGPGLENIEVNLTGIGFAFDNFNEIIDMGNAVHGIALMKGASNVTIGGEEYGFTTMITNQTAGAGIYIHGSDTANNRIAGCSFGKATTVQDDRGNNIGLQITGGAHSNLVGTNGYYPNEFYYNDIAILLESGGNPNQTIPETGVPFTPGGANVIFGNTIGQNGKENRVGIKLVQGAQMNRIGGTGPRDANSIYGNSEAGILIDGVTHSRPEFANRIIGNKFYGSGSGLDPVPDPRAGALAGCAILLKNGTSNQIIGGLNKGEGNVITTGLIGIGVEDSSNNLILGNDIGGSDFIVPQYNYDFRDQNKQVGIFLRNSDNNRIGPGNLIAGNGLEGNITLGGVYLQNSDGNYVVGNTFGREAIDPSKALGDLRENIPNGITLDDSGSNFIGYPSADGLNTIGLSTSHGIHLTGSQTTGNLIENNSIGVDPFGQDHINGAHGILVENGAAANTIAGNTIHKNGLDGIHIDGATSTQNQITLNSISGHSSGLGIRLSNSANSSIAPPSLETKDGIEITGTAPTGTPDGSTVEFFYDPLVEGLVQLGASTVQNEKFSFNAALAPGLRITATLTDTAGNTSQFSPVATIDPTFGATVDIRRDPSEPTSRTEPNNQLPIPVLPLKLTAPPNVSVSIETITFDALGSIDESTGLQGVALYRDEDNDGTITSLDTLLGELQPITEDDGSVTLSPAAFLQADTSEHWLLAASPTYGTDPDFTLEFQLASGLKVDSRTALSNTPILETGTFPALSDTVTLTAAPDPYETWRSTQFSGTDLSDDNISGRNADPDKDGIPNLLEYAIGSDPKVANNWNIAKISITDTHYIFQIPITETQLNGPITAEASYNLLNWSSGPGVADIVGPFTDNSGTLYLVVKVPLPIEESTPVFVRLK